MADLPVSLAERLKGLDEIGVGPAGVNRFAWSDEDRATRQWFERQAKAAGLTVARDPAGNLWACPPTPAPWWGVGSHLDSVRGGGRFDGPLGVAAAFEIAQSSDLPLAVISFADEEGARFNTPTFGSKALTGVLDTAAVLARADDQGITLAEAMRADQIDPDQLETAPQWLDKLKGFIELHIDQNTLLAEAEAPVGIVTALASRMRLEVTFTGQADHAGTTPPTHRHDALGTAARLIVAAEEIGAELGELTVTSSRILVEPNATTTVAARVRLWIDARSADPDRPGRWLTALRQHAERLAEGARVPIAITVASQSAGREFSPEVRAALHRAGEQLLGHAVPDSVCFAGHDAGLLAAKIPAGMVLVRNPTGISHAPDEHVELADAEVGVALIERALWELAQ
jgi:beta-ureidopropionase / N-carbamoyl-L-amino-acid hydrolase